MKIFSNAAILLLIGVGMICGATSQASGGLSNDRDTGKVQAMSSPQTLWYRQPAGNWRTALPIGNGRLGAMVFGGVSHEKILLNEVSLWSGAPINNPPKHNLVDHIPEVRRLLFAEKTAEAEELLWKIIEPSSGLHTSHFGNSEILGSLNIESADQSKVTNYRRSLNLDQALASVTYVKDNVTFRREVFSSAVDQVMWKGMSGSRRAQSR